MNMKMALAVIALVGSTSLAVAQNNNNSGSQTDQGESRTTPSECMNMNIPVDQLSDDCKNERAMMQNQNDGTATGSTTVLPEGQPAQGTGGDADSSSNRNDSGGAKKQ